MIASPLFAKRYLFIAIFLWLVAALPLVAGELSFRAMGSTDASILMSSKSTGQATVSSPTGFNPEVKIIGADAELSGIRLVDPKDTPGEKKPVATISASFNIKQEPSETVADQQREKPKRAISSQKVHRAVPIAIKTSSRDEGEIELAGAAPDQSLRAIQLLSALSTEWDKKPQSQTPSPFKEEPVRTAPKPKKTVEQPSPKKPETKPSATPKPQRKTPAPIESPPAPIETFEPVKPLKPNDHLNDDLPYYNYDKGCGEKSSGPFRMARERMRERLFRGPIRQKMKEYQADRGQAGQCQTGSGQCQTGQCQTDQYQAGSCQTGQCQMGQYPTGDPWGPGHWVGPGIWMPDRSAQRAAPMSAGPVYSDELPRNADGTYGWGPPQRLFAPRFLADRDITLGGWIDQGITYNASNPADRYNGPVTFNDRSGDYQMNQVDVFLERTVDGSESGLEIGGRVDALFGTDARFTEAVGWETNWDMNERFYRLSVPQVYADFGLRDWTVRMGHFYTTIGYESVPSVNNFFYSHSYSMQYGEPFTHTGMLAFRKINSQLKVNAGFHRGWDQFNGIYGCNRLSVLTGANWKSRNGRLKFDFALTAGPQSPDNSTVMYSMVGTYIPRGWLELVVQHDYGQSTGDNPHGIRMAEWYSISQYAFVTLNERWKVGARVECFCDKQGVRVHGLGQGNLAAGPYPGDFWEVTLGLNWEPSRNVRIRPEVRWDWYSATGATVNRPFDAGDSSKQFLLGVDAIVQF